MSNDETDRYPFAPLRTGVRRRPGGSPRQSRRGGRRAAPAPGHRLREPRTPLRALPPPSRPLHPDDGAPPHVGERQSPLAGGAAARRRAAGESPRGDPALLRRRRDRPRPLLEPRVPRRADRGLPPPDRPGAALRAAHRGAHPRGVARDARNHPTVPRARTAGRLPRLLGHAGDLPRAAHARGVRLRHRRRGNLPQEPPRGGRARNGSRGPGA